MSTPRTGPASLAPATSRQPARDAQPVPNLTRALLGRELGRRAEVPAQSLVPCFNSRPELVYRCVDPRTNGGVPVYAMLPSRRHCDGRLLLVSDEDGHIKHLDVGQASRLVDTFTGELAEPLTWRAHTNAVFDMALADCESKLVTASGDHTAAVFDMEYQTRLTTLRGHTGSLKCVCVATESPNVVATGARDGCLMWWDLRSATQQPVAVKRDAHVLVKKRKRSTSLQRTHTSITAAAFARGGTVLASAGQPDGLIKFWDLRKIAKPQVTVTIPAPTGSERIGYQHGVSSLALDSTGSRMLACCANSRLYVYDCANPESNLRRDLPTFMGHRNSSFYVKAVWSPDDRFILSGSCDENAYIWEADKPGSAPFVLTGHKGDVTAVDWSHVDFTKLTTGGDDGTVRVWSLDRTSSHQRLCRKPGALFGRDERPSNGNAVGQVRVPTQTRTLQHFWTNAAS